jgi:hypothetical protein
MHPATLMKRLLSIIILIEFFISATAQLKSPESFLGYKIGEHFTPHAQLVNYFRHAAEAAPEMMSITEYGKTNEGRPLLLAYISTAENIRNLENIRKNNLRLTNMALDRMAPVLETPVIVWLSYNVHGNEPSSSEASMLTLYSLLDASNTNVKAWLKNTVVIIDPCMNPDGRDRYVNWFNSVSGKKFNPRVNAREHSEPWPGGRTNHYNFDLNRDWAWQTQVETKQRMKLYHQWIPQVHVDFHEQDVNAPYYFAPAAEPFHEVITPWQRNFQQVIGKNHAKYFDQQGWLYFTKEVFDLYYPSYGDTYPTYNGAIGMTYEQGGGPRAGLGVLTDAGDTLTLYDRALHHFTTSMSTIETAAMHASLLVKEFRKFFNDAITAPTGVYKSYILKNQPAGEQRINALLELLKNNGIQWAAAKGNYKGYRFGSGKEETVNVTEHDIVVPVAQPKAAMVQVLFEPSSRLVDSNTYDITAWALPYVYGLDAYAVKEKVNLLSAASSQPAVTNTISPDAYGYLVPWEGKQSVRMLTALLKKGIRIRFSEQPFELNGERFERGTLIVLKTSNQSQAASLWNTVVSLSNELKVKVQAVSTGFVDKGYDFGSSKIHSVKAPVIGLVTGEGTSSNSAGEIWHFFEQEIDYPVTLINFNNNFLNNLKDFDVLILPDGNYSMLSGTSQAAQLKEWINSGGKLVAMEGAAAAIAKLNWGIRLKNETDSIKEQTTNPYQHLRAFENRERDLIRNLTPGSIFKVELDNTHPLAFGYPAFYYTLKQDDRIYEYIEEDGWNVGIIKKKNQVAGFVGHELKERLKDGLLFGVLEIGRGSLVVLSENPLFRDFWENGKLLFSNAIFMVGR